VFGIGITLAALLFFAAYLSDVVANSNMYTEASGESLLQSTFGGTYSIATLLSNGLWTCESVLNNASNTPVTTELINFIVGSSNMVPTLNVNDKIGFNKSITFDTLKLGDIIVFQRTEMQPVNGTVGPQVVLSRITEIQTDSRGERVVTTKADANPESIPGLDFPIRLSNYLGKVVCQYR
jgi:hypothetical protein